MLEPINIVVQWPKRKEGAKQCAERLGKSLVFLEKLSPVFSTWVESSESITTMLNAKPLATYDAGVLVKLLKQGQSRNDLPIRDIIPELGYNTLVWNRDSGGSYASFSTFCGSYGRGGGYNSASISIRQFNPPVLRADELLLVMKEMLKVWEANLGVVLYQRSQLSDDPVEVLLAHYCIPGTDFNRHWLKVGKVAEIFRGGELRIDEVTRPMFDSGIFKAPKSKNLISGLIKKFQG